MDYNRNECQATARNSDGNLFNLKPSAGVSYFEAVCLRGNLGKWRTANVFIASILSTGRDCGALWTFERFLDMELRVTPRETIRDVSKAECQDRCLKSSSFVCLSSVYDHLLEECYLNDVNRFDHISLLQSLVNDSISPHFQVYQPQRFCDSARRGLHGEPMRTR